MRSPTCLLPVDLFVQLLKTLPALAIVTTCSARYFRFNIPEHIIRTVQLWRTDWLTMWLNMEWKQFTFIFHRRPSYYICVSVL